MYTNQQLMNAYAPFKSMGGGEGTHKKLPPWCGSAVGQHNKQVATQQNIKQSTRMGLIFKFVLYGPNAEPLFPKKLGFFCVYGYRNCQPCLFSKNPSPPPLPFFSTVIAHHKRERTGGREVIKPEPREKRKEEEEEEESLSHRGRIITCELLVPFSLLRRREERRRRKKCLRTHADSGETSFFPPPENEKGEQGKKR